MKMYESSFKGTWLDRKGTAYNFRSGRLHISDRVIFQHWHDTGTVEWKHCSGDGRTDDFVSLAEGELPGDLSVDQMRKLAYSLLFGYSYSSIRPDIIQP